jgi:predicted O-methyltransferase YrrM
MRDVLLNYANDYEKLQQIDRILKVVDSPDDFTPLQGYAIAAIAQARKAELILDLGTGLGNSAAVFGQIGGGAKTLTFDFDDKWTRITLPKLLAAGFNPNVTPVVGDITKLDFTSIISDARSVVLFWDAHGFAIADLVFAHIMPLIADRQHIVVCHDMTYAPAAFSLDYDGKTIWKGTDAFYAPNSNMAYIVTGWAISFAEQVVSIFDFCQRNDIEFHSIDVLMGIREQGLFEELGRALNVVPMQKFRMGYFSMEETRVRRFPARDGGLF